MPPFTSGATMAKLTLSNVTNISGAESVALGVINANSDAIETALENTLSRNGTSPNSMAADLDMGNNDILNVDNIDVNTLTIDGVPVVTTEDLYTADPELLALAGLTSAANKLPYFTGSGTAALADFTANGRAIVASSTPAEARTVLEIPSYSDLYYIDGMDNGLTGNSGEDQTTALQNIIDNIVPTEGGIIKYRGYVDFTTIDLYGRRNIVFQGMGGNGAGATQSSILRSTAGAIGSGVPAIKLWKTFGIGFEKTMVLASNAAFNGVLLDFNDTTPAPGDDSALMHIRDSYIYLAGSSGVGLDLYGSTQGVFENNTFSGAGTLIKLQDVAGVGFCNVHRFGNSHIKPTGSNYPVLGSGEAITFDTCNVQASSSDHIGRFWLSSQNQAFKGITIRGCTTYDVTASGGISSYFYRGNGLNLFGNNFGGTSTGANYAMQIGGGPVGANDDGYGVSGFNVIGNNFEYLTAGVSFAGTAGNHNQARNGVFFGNTARGTMPAATHTIIYAGISSTKNVLVLPNFTLNTSTNAELLDCLYMYDWPNYADRAAAVSDGRTTGQVFKETTSGQGYLCVV
jgi:hypothetical protein